MSYTPTSNRTGSADTYRSRRFFRWSLALVSCVFALIFSTPAAFAQTGGEAGIQGTVTDPTGAAIPGATITATDNASGVATTRTSTSDGLYTISPIPPGIYTVKVTAPGFSGYVQNNLHADALVLTGLNVTMKVGSTDTSVTVTEAPPALDTTNAQLGLTMENDTYQQLPILMQSAQRDPTYFANLTPGAQGGARLPIIGGSGNYLGQLYLEGLPAETVSQQGDNRVVSLSVDLDAVDQFQVVTSTPAAEYSGAGAENFTMKSGGNKYHGSVNEYVRNTIFDAWTFTAKAATVKNAAGQTVPAGKPIEHQNEFSVTFGGHVPFDKKMFFFVAYDRFHFRKGVTPSLYTIPTTLERTGDFTELNGNPGSGETGTGTSNPAFLYDPTSTTCNPTCTRQPFMGLKNGVPTYNVIPSNEISPIAQKMQSFLPDVTNSSVLNNNFLGGQPSGFDNQVLDWRYDWDISEKNRISTVGAVGVENYVNNFATPLLPLPYTGGDLAVIHPKNYLVEDRYTINNSMVNQLKFGFVRFYQNIHDATQGVSAYSPTTLGITNLPQGQGGQEFPGAAFTASGTFAGDPMQGWTTNSNSIATQLTTPNNFTLVDNFQWVKGKHSLTGGIQIQWQEINNANPATYTGVLDLTYNGYSTGNFSGTSLTPNGYSYASFLLGAVGGTPAIGLQPVSEEGGRYRPIAPYVEDSYKVTPKLTVDMGLRWDYLPPYHEVKDRWTYLNPAQTNSATGTPGQLEFAGNYGGAGVSCGCRTPVQTYWKNWGPRVGIAYQVDAKTVFRLGAGRVFSQGGGVGGRGGAYQGTGQTGFNVTATGPSEVLSGAAAGPSFYLNNSAYFTQVGLSNTSLFGSSYSYPAAPTPGPAAQILNSGNYLNSAGKLVTASNVGYADPYFSGRAPDFNFYNVGFERSITSNMTLAVNYVGNESHHLENSTNSGVGTARGYWSNQLNPIYLAGLGNATAASGTGALLTAPATAANVAKAVSVMGSAINIPTYFQAAAAVSSTATIAQGLLAFPQYGTSSTLGGGGVTDTWGQNVGNFSYNSLQITLQQRTSHGLNFNINYTYSKNIGDDGTFRNGFAIPAGAVSRNSQAWAMDRIDRSWTTVSAPDVLNAFGAYQLPFGTNHIGGGQNFLVRQLISGWSISGIYTYASGTPAAVISSLCTATNSPMQGQCMPDLATTTPGSARQNGSYGSGAHGFTNANLGSVQYFNGNAFQAPQQTATGIYLIGNAPRTRPLNLMNPGTQNLNAAVKRSFKIYKDVNFQFEADASNVWNKVTFANPNATWSPGSLTFGTIAGTASSYLPRDWQFAGHINF